MERPSTWTVFGLLLAVYVVVPMLLLRTRAASRLAIAEDEIAIRETLEAVAAAQEDLREIQRRQGGADGYWIADVAGLYAWRAADGQPRALIPRAVAEADAAPFPQDRLVSPPRPYCGYYFEVIRIDPYGRRYASGEAGGDGLQYNRLRFALCAYPAEYGVTGRATFMIDQTGAVRYADLGGRPAERSGTGSVVNAGPKMD